MQEYKTDVVKRKNLRFANFLQDVCKKLESNLPVKTDIKQAKTEITQDTLEQFKAEMLSQNNFSGKLKAILEAEELDPKDIKIEKMPLISIRQLIN